MGNSKSAAFDLDLYPPIAVIKAAHRFSGTHAVRVDRVDNSTVVTLTPRTEQTQDVVTDLLDAVIDETLRELVHARTAALHDTLVSAAFQPVQALQ
jgi:His-Xaa-Ser system protein HxsD